MFCSNVRLPYPAHIVCPIADQLLVLQFCSAQGNHWWHIHTLDSGINVAPGTFGENNKHSPLKKHIPLHQITEFLTFLWITLFNKDVAPGKKFKN